MMLSESVVALAYPTSLPARNVTLSSLADISVNRTVLFIMVPSMCPAMAAKAWLRNPLLSAGDNCIRLLGENCSVMIGCARSYDGDVVGDAVGAFVGCAVHIRQHVIGHSLKTMSDVQQ